MSKLQLRYGGWVTLPAVALKKFHLTTGDQLEVELTGDAIVLRRAQKSSAPERAAVEPVAMPEPVAAAAPSPIAKRSPGRPRKTVAAPLPPTPKTRGRRKAVTTVEAPAH